MIERSKSWLRVPENWLITCLISSTLLAAQQNPDPQKPKGPTEAGATSSSSAIAKFKSRADLVLVPVVVRNKGRFVPGLSKDSFHLEENGKEQSISLFEEVLPPTTNSTISGPADRGFSNLPFDNTDQLRLTIVVLDLLNTGPLQRTDGKDQLLEFLSKGLPPNQPISLLCLTSKGLKLIQPFTTDTNALVRALKQTPPGPPTVIPRRDVVVSTIRQLKELAQAYAAIPGRKTMILAAGYIQELATETQMFESSIYAGDLRLMWKSIIDANISVYPIQLLAWSRDPTLDGVQSRPSDLFLRQFAEETGGNRCLETNDLLGCLREAVDDSRTYYMLGFTVQQNDRKPGWRNLRVKVSAQNVNLRARNGFYYGEPLPEDRRSIRDQEINALASPLAYSSVPMYVKVLTAAEPASVTAAQKRTVGFLMTIPLSSLTIDPSRPNPLDLEVGAIALTSDTREAAELLHPVRGNPKPENLVDWRRDGIQLQEQLALSPGSYDVRFFVRDNNSSQIGTVVFPLEIH